MATPSRSRSSGRGEEDNSEWRQAIERRQLASERQLKALLQETERLREENAVLRIQASTSRPPRCQHSRGQVANAGQNQNQYILDNKSYPRSMQPKRQRDRRSQLSNSMRTRLGPQGPGRPRPPVATTGATRPDPMVTPVVQNVLPHRDPMVTPMVRNVHSHLAVRQDGRNLPSEPPIGSISKRLDDMLFMPLCSHIIHYEPPRGFLVPKFFTYDGSSDPFDHIMHYRQLMTLDIGNDALLCKVFPASLQRQALSWFHRLPPNSVGNFRDLSEAFGVREAIWSSRASDRGLQHGCCPADLQTKHLSKYPIFRITSQKASYDDGRRHSDVPTNIRCSKMTYGQPPSKFWLPDRHLEVARKEMLNLRTGQGHPIEGRKGQVTQTGPPLTPLSISYEKLLPMIQGLSTSGGPDPKERTHPKEIIAKGVSSTRNTVTQWRHVGASIIWSKGSLRRDI
ncbi:hypothetical protein CK203_117709 [Vitis vinifera]|uniref:Retrotransposon gag domain-containing protein n=1 Tax=Vitis vinifera TaxID=29760 RepID=A0A438DGQ5_VITVI|nr:hypothetical protein CK203_117709 [Vitis vinifera]